MRPLVALAAVVSAALLASLVAGQASFERLFGSAAASLDVRATGQVLGWKVFRAPVDASVVPAADPFTKAMVGFPTNPNFSKTSPRSTLRFRVMLDVIPSDDYPVWVSVQVDSANGQLPLHRAFNQGLVSAHAKEITYAFSAYLLTGAPVGTYAVTVWVWSSSGAQIDVRAQAGMMQMEEVLMPAGQV